MKKIEIATTGSTLINAYVIESEKVKVFPCSYRGFDESKNIFDPEATGFTEYNFVNIYGKQTKLISWSDDLLKCVIDGYYFEINGIKPTDFCIDGQLYKFAIVLEDLTIVGSYKTKVLKSIKADNDNYLDTKIGEEHYFTGLALIDRDTNINGAIYFSPCKLVGEQNNKEAVIDWQAYRLTDVLDTSDGDGSVRMLGTNKTGESTFCSAPGENAFAIGKNTEASGKFSIAGGTESKAKHENSVAIGDHVNTSADNQVVFGAYNEAYNEKNAESALIIGGGSESVQKNVLEVSKTGDINATGKLDVAGNISSSNGGLQLTNGFISIDNGYEYQKILDTATYDSSLTYYEKNAETDEMTEKAVTAETFASLKNNLYIKLYHLSSLDNNGNLLVDGNAQINKKLTANEQTEIKGNITGHGNLTINGAGSTHELIIGSSDGTGDYGSITVHGKGAQETKITAFSVDNQGNTTIAKTLTVGTNKLVVDANGVSINNSKVTIENPTTINNTLAVNGATTITAGTVTTIINEEVINYNNNFAVTNDGSITAKSLTLTGNYGINEQGIITGSELELKDGYKIAANGDATLKDLIINNATLAGIKLEKGSYTVQDTDGAREINNSDALKITRYIENSDSGSEETAQGLHVNGQITTAGDFAIGESSGATTKITQGGTAYFKQGLLVGGKVTGANEPDDTVTFRIASFSSEAEQISYADLKGDLNVKKYNNKAGKLTVEGDAKISGSLTVGSIKFDNNNNIIGINRITATQFNATSDARKKTAIQDYICKKSILDLPIKEFEFIGDETHTKHIGCIAQDLQEICPEIVHKDADGYLSIEETKLVYLLLQEVKELKKELKILKGE